MNVRKNITVLAATGLLATAGCTYTIYTNGKPGIVVNNFSMKFERTPLQTTQVRFKIKTVVRPEHLSGQAILTWFNKGANKGKGAWLEIAKSKFGLAAIPAAGHSEWKTFTAACHQDTRERLELIFHTRWPAGGGPPTDDTIYYPGKNSGKSTGSCGGSVLGSRVLSPASSHS